MTESQKASVREIELRRKAAEDWAKATGYEARDYWDVLGDLDRTLSLIRQQESEIEAMRGVVEAARHEESVYPGKTPLTGVLAALRSPSVKKEGKEK